MCTVLHAIVAAALSLLTGSSAPRCSARQSTGTRRGPQLVWLYLVGAGGWVGRSRAGAARPPGAFFYGTIAFGLQASASSSPRRFQPRSLRPPLGPPPHRRPQERLSSEGLHRPSRASFPAPSSPSRFPASQVRLRSLCARACLAGSGGEASWTGTADRTTPSFYVARCAGIAAALGLVPALTLPSEIAKACVRLGSKQPSSPARTDDSTDPLPSSMALPRLSTRHFGLRRPAQVWTDAAPLPLFGPLAREGDGAG
jgi:hypothetical protein